MDPKSNNANNYFVSDQQAKQVEEAESANCSPSYCGKWYGFDCDTTIPSIIDEIDEELSLLPFVTP